MNRRSNRVLRRIHILANAITDDPTRTRRFLITQGTDYHGQRLYWSPIEAVQVLVGLLTTMKYSTTRINPLSAGGAVCSLSASSRHIHSSICILVLSYI